MMIYLLTAIELACVFYSSLKLSAWLMNVIVGKFITDKSSMTKSVHNLLSLLELKYGEIKEGGKYSIETPVYAIKVFKKEENNK